jgi:hypothetical protein
MIGKAAIGPTISTEDAMIPLSNERMLIPSHIQKMNNKTHTTRCGFIRNEACCRLFPNAS